MSWKKLTVGRGFVTDETLFVADPYLAWAQATDFVNFIRAGDPIPQRLQVLVELAPNVTPFDLERALGVEGSVCPVYLGATTRYCTAWFSPKACRDFSVGANGVVERFEFTMPVLPQRPPADSSAVPMENAPHDEEFLLASTETLLAVIDNGCPFAHAAFRRDGSSRLIRLWDQDADPVFGIAPAIGRVPPNLQYGREVGRGALDALVAACTKAGAIDEDACYEMARYTELRSRVSHGAHVLDQFIGPRRLRDRVSVDRDRPPSWCARTALLSDTSDVVFVQLPRDAWADPAGNALATCALDGIRYILGCAGAQTKNVVVNISCALYTGPHNGTSILERALAELISTYNGSGSLPQLHVYMPSGNSFNASWHASATVLTNGCGEARVRVPPDSEAPTFVQIWCESESESPRISVAQPGAVSETAVILTVDQASGLHQTGAIVAAAFHVSSTARGAAFPFPGSSAGEPGTRNGSFFLLAIEASRNSTRPGGDGPSGVWNIGVTAQSQTKVRVYVGRNESELGAPLRARPARLVDAAYDPKRYLRSLKDDPADAEKSIGAHGGPRVIPVKRRGTMSGVASGAGTRAVAGLYLHPDQHPTEYSSAGMLDPLAAAVCDEYKALRGIRGAGTRSGVAVRLVGTSFAAPQRARADVDRVVCPKLPSETVDPHGPPQLPRTGRWGTLEEQGP